MLYTDILAFFYLVSARNEDARYLPRYTRLNTYLRGLGDAE